MKKYYLRILAVLGALTSLWLGSYFLYLYPTETWQSFPIFATSTVCGMLCLFLAIYGEF